MLVKATALEVECLVLVEQKLAARQQVDHLLPRAPKRNRQLRLVPFHPGRSIVPMLEHLDPRRWCADHTRMADQAAL